MKKEHSTTISRRSFIKATATTAVTFSIVSPQLVRGSEANSKINIGIIGCGGRGQWITDLFQKNGNYNIAAVSDYFQDRVDSAGKRFNVPESNRFTGLNGYKRLLDLKIDAVAIETPPYFHPQQAADAIDAGKHVYLAKPIAVDVPGCMSISESSKKATGKKLVFLVDFQTRAHPAYQEVVNRAYKGDIGKIITVFAEYQTNLMFESTDAYLKKDPTNPEYRLRSWGVDRILSGDVITEQNIHTLDVATWFINADPIKAYGTGGKTRPFVGDCWDHFAVIYYFPNDIVCVFCSKQVGFGFDDIMCRVHGTTGTIETYYGGKVWMRSREDGYNGDTRNLYEDGTVRDIARFYNDIVKGDFSNPTVSPSVRSNLTTILGRQAAYKNSEVTWDQMMNSGEKFEFNTKGLKI